MRVVRDAHGGTIDLSLWQFVRAYALPDGRLACCCDQAMLVTRDPVPPDAEPAHHPTSVTAFALASRPPTERDAVVRDAVVSALDAAKIGTEDMPTCPNCKSTGRVDCRCCGGSGTYKCIDPHCGLEHACTACHGLKGTRCYTCLAILPEDRRRRPVAVVRVLDRPLDAFYLTPLRAMGPCSVTTDSLSPKSAVVFDDGVLCLVVAPRYGHNCPDVEIGRVDQ